MAKHSAARQPFGTDGSRFPVPAVRSNRCSWQDCRETRFDDLPVCGRHAMAIADRMREEMQARYFGPGDDGYVAPPAPPSYVYYLMLGPATVSAMCSSRPKGAASVRISPCQTDLSRTSQH